MRASVRLAFAIAALAFAVVPVVRAEDAPPAAAKTYPVRLRERWKAGDVTTRAAKETFTRTVEVHQGDETKKLPSSERQTSYVVVAKCLEADAEGYATKMVLYLTAWSIEVGPQKDSSLAGVHLELTGKGADRTWKLLTPDAAPSEAAKAWIEQYYGKKSAGEQTYADLEPKAEVAVGGTWEGDGPAIGKRLAERGIAVDVEQTKATGTLVGVEGTAAHLDLKISFPTKELGLPNGQKLPWKEGGVLELTFDMTRPLLAGEFDSKLRREQKYAGVADAGDGTIVWDDVASQEIEITTGGKMPAVPAAAAPADGDKKEPEAPKPDGK